MLTFQSNRYDKNLSTVKESESSIAIWESSRLDCAELEKSIILWWIKV